MQNLTYGVPFTDPTRVINTLSVERSYEKFELWYGKQRKQFFQDSVVTVNIEMEDTQSSGIQPPNVGGSGVLESAQLVVAEETNNVPKIPRFPGQDMPDDDRLIKAFAPGVRWLGATHTITLSGRGAQVWGETEQGNDVGGQQIASAYGSFSIEFPTGARVERVGRTATNTGEPDTWTGESSSWVPNEGNTSSGIIGIPDEIASLLPSPSVVLCQDTYVMNGDVKQNVRHTFQATCHLAD